MLRRQARSGTLADWRKRIEPVSREFGFGCRNPIDRYHIENFLARHAEDIQGHVLKIANNAYTGKFGGERVLRSDVLHGQPGSPSSISIEGQELPVSQGAEASARPRSLREAVSQHHGSPRQSQRLGKILKLLDRQGFCYLIHDFDAKTCGATKPPFRLSAQTTSFCLVYAWRMDD